MLITWHPGQEWLLVITKAPGNIAVVERTRAIKPLRAALNQAAHAAARTKNTYLSAQYHHLVGRRGAKKAIVAVAHSILVIAYHLIDRKESYKELGGDYFDKRSAFLRTLVTNSLRSAVV